MPNPLFSLIENNFDQFRNLNYSIELKYTSDVNEPYYLFRLNKFQSVDQTIFVDNNSCQLDEMHITVFESPINSNESYHITLHIAGFEEIIIVRAYFDSNDKRLFVTCTNQQEKQIILNSDSIKQIVNLYQTAFINLKNVIFAKCQKQYQDTRDDLLGKMCELSKDLTNHDNKKKYLETIKYLIVLIRKWRKNTPDADTELLTFFDALSKKLASTTNVHEPVTVNSFLKIAQQIEQAKPTAEIPSTPITKKTEHVSNQIRVAEIECELEIIESEKIDVLIKIIKKYALYEQIFKIGNDNEALNAIKAMENLKRDALREVIAQVCTGNDDLLIDSPSNQVRQDFIALLELIDIIPDQIAIMCVKNNKPELLVILLNKYPLNVNLAIPNTDTTLLKYSYDVKNLKMFKLLLEHHAVVDIRFGEKGITLLMQACLDNREEEMVLLLQARANPFIRDKRGYIAIAPFLLVEDYNLTLAKRFFENCTHKAKSLLNFAQGQFTIGGSTAGPCLAYLCQINASKVVKFCLEHGADPRVVRMADFRSTFAVSAIKLNFESCKILFDNIDKYVDDKEEIPKIIIATYHDVKNIYGNAFGYDEKAFKKIIKYLEDIAKTRNINLMVSPLPKTKIIYPDGLPSDIPLKTIDEISVKTESYLNRALEKAFV